MLSVQTNMMAWNANRQLELNRKKKEKSAEKLASGYKINRASDDAAGLAISEKMRRQIRGLQKGKENIVDGISWVQIGDGAMEEIAQMLHRMEELAVKGANGTLQAADRIAIDEEIQHLKREINNIAKYTVFNDKKIFDNDQIEMDIEGSLDDLEIFNASYDDKTGEVTYGGFLFRGQRISWDTIDTNMVYYDADTHQQYFNGGSYDFYDANGYHFHVDCEPGATVPELTRTVEVKAYEGGITLDGMEIPWSQVYDEDGKSALEICHDGTWYADYKGLTLAFYFPDGSIGSREDMINAISTISTHDSKIKYHLQQTYTGSSLEQAVDVVKMDQLRVSNHLARDTMNGTDGFLDNQNRFTCIVRADSDPDGKNGIWLEYEYEDANGVKQLVEAAGSYRTWASMGLADWFNGYDVKGNYQYTYTGDDSNPATIDDTYISFNFTLSDVTSVDSVIDGLDGMRISGNSILTKYGTEVDITLDDNIIMASSSSRNNISFQEERDLGRDFDQQTVDNMANSNLVYDSSTGKVTLQFKDSAGNAVIEYEGDTAVQRKRLDSDLDTYGKYVEARKVALALAGRDPQSEDLGSYGLADLIGNDKITLGGYFDEIITIDQDMKLSNGDGYFEEGELDKQYPAAKVDFTGLGNGNISLDRLVGTGFDSTCKTCSNHYSVMFTDGGAEKMTDDGYGYTFRNNGSGNYTLQIDISTLKDAGVNTAADLSDAIVDIVSECYDFHYTQYASKNGTLYIYDDRSQSMPATSATFDPWPFQSIDIGDYNFSVETDDGRSISTSYKYRFSDFADNIEVKMQQNNAGDYVKLQNANGDDYYVLYNPTDHGAVPDSERYDLVTTYKDIAGNQVGSLQDARNSYADQAIDKMFKGSKVQLNALDYTTMAVYGSEKQNVAIRSIFDTEFNKESIDDGIILRCSAQDGDRTTIPRFGVNTFALKLYKAGAKTQEQADQTMDITKQALTLLNERRSTYGAIQNRLEHAYNIRDNTQENTQAAESRLRDTDVAKEMLTFSNHNILMQVGVSMLAQANSSSQFALQLLQ